MMAPAKGLTMISGMMATAEAVARMEADPVVLVSHHTRANWTRDEPKSENAWLIQNMKKGFFQLALMVLFCVITSPFDE